MKEYIGFDIGGTYTKAGIIDENGSVRHHFKFRTPDDYSEFLAEIERVCNKLSADRDITGVGISVPGVIYKDHMMSSGALKFIDKNHFASDCRKAIGNKALKVVNDANAVALAERWIGGGQGIDNFVCVTLGTAIGGSIFINGKLYEGFNGLGGEFGASLTIKSDPLLIDCVSAKCGVVAGACRRYSSQSELKTRDFEVIIKRADEGEALAIETVKEFCEFNGALLFNIAYTLAPEKIMLGGGISRNDRITKRIFSIYHELTRKFAVIPAEYMPAVECCRNRSESGIIGAVYPLIKEVIS